MGVIRKLAYLETIEPGWDKPEWKADNNNNNIFDKLGAMMLSLFIDINHVNRAKKYLY